MSHHPTPNNDVDYKIRTLDANLSAQDRRIDLIEQLLRQYPGATLYGFDPAGNPKAIEALARDQGGWVPPAVTPGALQPGSDVSTTGDPKYTITYGTYGGFLPTIGGTNLVPNTSDNIIMLGASDIAVYMQCDFTYDVATGIITITDAEIMSTASTIPMTTISGGIGTLYQELFGVTVTSPVGSGPYTVIAAAAVGGSQNFGICLAGPSINGPWGV